MGLDDAGLNLGLGFAAPATAAAAAAETAVVTMDNRTRKKAAASSLEPSLTLGISSSISAGDDQDYSGGGGDIKHGSTKLYGRVDSPATTSFSNGSLNRASDGEEDIIINYNNNNNNNNNNNSRKKLRLNRDQSALLEQCFKQHSTLNPKQKQELARKLNLRPRQVEVWFQNRRARTKLKQTEINCEFLKKCCETLTEENIRLQKELHELKSLKLPGLYMQLPATTLSICPACERIGTAAGDSEVKDSDDKNVVSMVGSNPTRLYNAFVNPSAAC